MAALSRRDIEMIFRAETDKATRPIADLGKAVKSTREQLSDLVDAAAKGEVSLDKLGDATRDLKKAQDELGTARGLLTQLNSQESALEKAEKRATDAAAKYEELQKAVAGAEAPTKKLVNSMEAAGRASNAASENLERVRTEAAETRGQIEAIIGPVGNVGEAFRTIATTSQEIARGLAVAGNAADDFKKKAGDAASAAAAVDAKLNSDVSFEQQGRSAGLLQAQIDYISQFENRVELLNQAKRELASQNANFDKALSAQEAKAGAANVDELRRSIQETFDAAARADRVTAFQEIAQQAKAGLADVERFGVSEDAVAASTDRLATALGAILNPSAAVNRSIDSVEASIVEASKVLDNGRQSAKTYGDAMNELSSAAAGIVEVARKVDGFKAQQQAVQASEKAFEEARKEALALADALAEPGDDAEALAKRLRTAESAVETTGNAMQQQRQKAAEMAAALKRAGVDVDNLSEAEKRLAAAAHEAAQAGQDIQRQTGGGIGGLFGLNPQDATNLSYQINDIFTQLASGQSIFITLAQQGPQIWQIEGVKAFAASLSGVLLPLAGVAAGLGLVVGAYVALNYAATDSQALMNARGYIASLGEAGTLTAQQIVGMTDRLKDFGAKAEEAQKIVRSFNEDGLNPSYIDEYTQALKNAAAVTGEDMPTAANALSEAFNGGYDSVVKLNEQFPVLTDAELAQIKAMYDSGEADKARQLIFDRFTAKYAEAADKMNGPWANAWDNLKAAAARFGNYLAGQFSRIIGQARSDMDDLAVGVNYLLLRLRGLDNETAGKLAVQGNGRVQPKQGRGPIVTDPKRTTSGGQAAIADAERELDVRKRLTAAQRKENAAIEARRKALNAGYSPSEANRLADLASAKEGRAIADENAKSGARAAKKAQSARDKAAREAETLANKIKGQSDQLESALDTMGAKVAKVAAGSLQDQLSAAADAVEKQYDATLRKVADFSKLTGGKGKIGDKTIPEYTAQIQANKAILTQQAQLKVYEDNVNATLAQRKQLLADIEDKAARGDITSGEAIKQTAEVTSRFDPIIADLTTAAINFAKSIGGAKPSAELEAFIAKMQSAGSRNAGTDQADVRKSANANIGREETKLNQILSERNSLVESYNTLVELGLMSSDEARKKSAAAYNESKTLIDTQLAALRQTVQAARDLGAISPQAFEAFEAKMKAIGAQATYINPQFQQLKQGVDNLINQTAMQGIDDLAKAFAGWATGTMSLGEAFHAALNAFVNFIGQTIAGIGKLIIQMVLLDAIQKVTGIPVAALLQLQSGTQGNNGQSASGGLFGFLGKLFHGGGTVGQGGSGQRTSRISISPAAIAAAPRYHEGTPSVGLKPNEQVAVLERGEKVMTEEQQRQEAAAKARQTGSGKGLRQVLAFGDDQVAAAMSGLAGEDVTLTHIRRNVPILKQMLDQG